MKPDAPLPSATPDESTPSSPAAAAPPASRPRLNLAKRTVSVAETDAATPAEASSKASPFGAARPIDTQARDKELEEKRQLSLQQKKEQDEKSAEEKKTRDDATRATKATERAARADRADKGQAAEKVSSPTSESNKQLPKQNGRPAPKENGEVAAQPKPSFSILKHEENGEEGEEDAVDGPANGNIVGDKETKPQEIVREVPKEDGNAAQQNADTTADSMEDDGWSTVAAKPKNGRKGGQRALAS